MFDIWQRYHLMTVRSFALLSVAMVAGCGAPDVERGPYVRQNLALLRSVPAISRAHLVRTASEPQRTGDGEGRIQAYRTTRIYDLPHGTTSSQALRFYRNELVGRGWRVVTSGVHHLNMGRGEATSLQVLAGRGRVYIGADYHCSLCLVAH
jgi:hypothetical protein